MHRYRPTATTASDDGDFRAWSDASGGFSIEAEYVRMVQARVTLKTRDGRFVTVPLAKLSSKDQDYVRAKKND